MDDIDRTSHTYQLKKSLLRKAWDGQSELTGPEMVAKILEMRALLMRDTDRASPNYPRMESLLLRAWDGQCKRTGPEMMAEILERQARVHDAAAHERAINNVNTCREEVLAEVRETKKDIREHAERRHITGEEDKDPPELQAYINEERRYDEGFRKHLKMMGTPAYLMPEPLSDGMIRLNAIERMKGSDKHWRDVEDSEKIKEARQLIEWRNPSPTLH